MNNRPFTIIVMLCGFLLSACTTSSPAIFTPPAADADRAVVYIYRPTEMANALYSPGININGEFKFYAKNGVSSRISLEPGDYLFEFQAEKKYSKLTPLSLTLKTGTLYFIRVSTTLKVKESTGYEPYARSFSLSHVDEPQAAKEIAKCCLGSGDDTEVKASKKETGDGFSVDKTQNPFSH